MKTSEFKIHNNLSLPSWHWDASEGSDTDTPTKKGVILFLHGFCNHASNYAYVGEWFSDKGYSVIAYDHRDHGSSPLRNQQCSIDDLVNDARIIVKTLSEQHPELPIYLMGSSMGGALSILACDDDTQARLNGLILWAPQVVSTERRKLVFKALSGMSKLVPALKLYTGPFAKANLPRQCNDTKMTEQMANDTLMMGNPSLGMVKRVIEMGDLAAAKSFNEGFRLLMLYGGSDTLVFKHDIKRFVAKVDESSAEILYHFYPENRHMLWADLNRNDIYQDTLNWMQG